MLRATDHAAAGHWPADQAADAVVLIYDDRYRRRQRVRTVGGRDLLIDLSAAIPMAEGDGVFVPEIGDWIAIQAASEPVMEIRATDPVHLARIAWHIGNRHLAAEISHDCLLIRPDHVIAEMVIGLGGRVRQVSRPFQPEGGAYAGHGHGHEHDHGHGHGHGHDHA